jgi:DNA-binding NarL/FixJ family response regulator
VAVVEDHPLVRQGLEMLVRESGTCELVASAASLEELATAPPANGVPAFDVTAFDVVVLDLNLPGRSGADAVADLVTAGAAVVVFSASAGEADVLDALAAGAAGYVTKHSQPQEVVRALEVVAAGGSYVSPTLAGMLLRADRSAPADDSLTPREKEILVLVARGERDQDIAAQLYISISTVHSHLERIRQKTGRRRRPDLTRLAIEQGLL